MKYQTILENLEKEKEEIMNKLSLAKKRYDFFYRTSSEETKFALENMIDILEDNLKVLNDQIKIIKQRIEQIEELKKENQEKDKE